MRGCAMLSRILSETGIPRLGTAKACGLPPAACFRGAHARDAYVDRDPRKHGTQTDTRSQRCGSVRSPAPESIRCNFVTFPAVVELSRQTEGWIMERSPFVPRGR